MRRRHARAGVDLTLVQAAATTFQGTWPLPQQASFEAIRAIESGRPAVLIAVSGTSAAFDARGRRLAWVDQHETGAWKVAVPLSQERTLRTVTMTAPAASRDALSAPRDAAPTLRV
jgi:apolipoprotein N-acyltransferase